MMKLPTREGLQAKASFERSALIVLHEEYYSKIFLKLIYKILSFSISIEFSGNEFFKKLLIIKLVQSEPLTNKNKVKPSFQESKNQTNF